MEMFKDYDPGKFYDEMFGSDGVVKSHCAPLLEKFGKLDQRDFLARKANSELYFLIISTDFPPVREILHRAGGSAPIRRTTL